LKSEGYNAVYLSETNDEIIETGLKYVNNDACYPAIIVIGQLVNALKSGEYDLDNTSVIITQTGGGCRATNYIGLIRKALKDAGLEQISIISLNVSGLEKEQAFKITPSMANKIVQACVYGDLLMKLLLGTRPYEVEKGTSKKIYSKWQKKCYKAVSKGNLKEYKKNIKEIIEEFTSVKLKKKELPKVGIVGEILIKYHSFGNDNLIEKLEDEGVEVFLPDLMGFVKYCAYNNVIKEKLLKTGKKTSLFSTIALNLIDLYEKPVKEMLKDTKYRSTCNIYELAKNVDGILSTGNQTGEGWFLTAEMVELIKDGVENIVCVQPFACLPNHIVGKSVIKKLRSVYSDANIVAIDYDPGASHTNQVNRIKLMLTVAKEKNK
jgi:predicted nucleotide-binding protein (sugar kinase/HSP70/actin superfamily)